VNAFAPADARHAIDVTRAPSVDVGEVHDRRGRELYGLCRRLGLTADEANDAVQEAFLRLLAESASGTSIADPEAWAFRVTYRLAMDEHRLHRAVQTLLDRLPRQPVPASSDPVDRVALWAEVDRLPARQRAVIYLRYRADLSFERIGAVMGITANGARNNASEAATTLRRRFALEENDR
jgi:RNA polymerase sigma factor (sigma-70 family)